MIEFIKENWPVLVCGLIYIIQVGSVLKSQVDKLDTPPKSTIWRSSSYVPLPFWKRCLFMVPGVPMLWFLGNISVFELGRIFVRTWEWHKENKKKTEEEKKSPAPELEGVHIETVSRNANHSSMMR